MSVGRRVLGVALDARVLVGLHAALLVSIAHLWMRGEYEDRVFERLVAAVVRPEMDEQQKALAVLHAVHETIETRNAVLRERVVDHLAGRLFENALDVILIEGGQCGDHSMVLTRALQVAGLEARAVQMNVRGTWGGHIVAEAKIDGRWVALDSLFDLAFVKPNGELATVAELHADWEAFADQVPDTYDRDASYRDYRRTNWESVPVLMPAAKALMTATLGSEAA